MSFSEEVNTFDSSNNLKGKILLMYFLSVVKKKNRQDAMIMPEDYREKCDKVTEKIEIWHKKMIIKR
jgi:hypothetical protein